MRLIALIVLSAAVAYADPIAQPGHAIIKYYKEQAKEREALTNRQLRVRCESQLTQGFVADRRCQEWLEQEFSGGRGFALENRASLGLISLVSTIFAYMALI